MHFHLVGHLVVIVVLPGVLLAEDQLVANVKHRHPALAVVGKLGRASLKQTLLRVLRNVIVAVGRHYKGRVGAALVSTGRFFTARKAISTH